MVDYKKVLPTEAHFNEETFQVLSDISSVLRPEYRGHLSRYPCGDGLRDAATLHGSPPDVEILAEMVKNGEASWIGISWLLFTTFHVLAAIKKNMTPVQYADWLYKQCDQINQAAKYRAAWIEAGGEFGNSVMWPKGKDFTKKEALEYFRGWLKDGRSHTENWRTQNSCKIVPQNVLTYYTHAKKRDEDLKNLPIYCCESALYAIQENYRLGFPLVVFEAIANNNSSNQAGIAFARGGAKMFDAFWGLDLSFWETMVPLGEHTRINNCGTWIEGQTADVFFRFWITAYLAGCNTLLHESSDYFFHANPDESTTILSEYGYKAMYFYALTKDVLKTRGKTVVPFAVMLEEEHGYRGDSIREFDEKEGKFAGWEEERSFDQRQRLNIWCGRIPKATRGDWQVHRTVTEIWPMPDTLWKELLGQWPEEKKIDSLDPETELFSLIRAGEIDPREYSKYLRDTRWADCFDIIAEDVKEEVLKKYYKAILLAGDIKTDNGLWDRLVIFAEEGGDVALSLEQLDEKGLQAFKINKTQEFRVLFVHSALTSGTEKVLINEVLSLNTVDCRNEKAQVWMKEEKTGYPLILRIPQGRGYIYLFLVSYGLDSDARNISRVYRFLIDELYHKHVGIRKKGPGCQMIINVREKDTLVTLLNHTSRDWRGEVAFGRIHYPLVAEVRDINTDHAYPESLVDFGDKVVTVKVRVPAYGVKILSFGPKRVPQEQKRGLGKDFTALSKGLEEIRKEGPQKIIGEV